MNTYDVLPTAIDSPDRIATLLSPVASKILISVNPRAGAKSASDRVRPVEQALVEAGFQVTVTTDLAEVERLASDWHEVCDLKAVLAAGGDGTASAVRNVIPVDAPLLPLPLGTECLFAKHIGQSADPQAVCDVLTGGYVVRLDLGRVNSRLFLLMLSVGVDAEVVERMQAKRTGNITHAAYIKPTLQTVSTYKYPELRISPDSDEDNSEPISCRWLLGFNLSCYARGLPFAPDASGCDGLLDICTFKKGTLFHSLKYYWYVYRGKHLQHPESSSARLRKFRVEAVDGTAVAVQVDGDRAGRLPIDVEVLPGGLALVVSAYGARKLGFIVPTESEARR